MIMQDRDPYVNDMVSAVLALHDAGIGDPSGPEIASKMFGKPMPPQPLAQPAVLGGEIYNGVIKRLSKVRRQLEDVHSLQCALLGPFYYQAGLRDNPDALSANKVRRCLPGGGDRDDNRNSRRAVGLYITRSNDENSIYQAWLEFNGKPGAARVRRILEQTVKAREANVITTSDSVKLLTTMREHLRVTPEEALARITGTVNALPAG